MNIDKPWGTETVQINEFSAEEERAIGNALSVTGLSRIELVRAIHQARHDATTTAPSVAIMMRNLAANMGKAAIGNRRARRAAAANARHR